MTDPAHIVADPGRRRRWPTRLLATIFVVGLVPVVAGGALTRPPTALAETAGTSTQPHPYRSRCSGGAQETNAAAARPRGDSPPTTFEYATNPPAARDRLNRMAQRICASRGDAETGRFAFVHYRGWYLDNVATRPPKSRVRAVDESRWRAVDGSGRVASILFPAREPGPGPHARRKSETYGPGELVTSLPDPLTSDPAVLAQQIRAHQPPEVGPAGPLRAVNDINLFQVPNIGARRAILVVLRDTDGLQYRGRVVDRAGRAGVAISVDSADGVGRDVLILNPRTGDVLAYEMVALRDPGKLGIRRPTVLSYELYFARGRSDDTRTVADTTES